MGEGNVVSWYYTEVKRSGRGCHWLVKEGQTRKCIWENMKQKIKRTRKKKKW